MKKVIFDNPFEKKKIHEESIVHDRQKHLQFLFDISNQIISPACKIIISEIKKKLYSYKSQDKIKGKYDEEQFITYDELIRKLCDSNLMCYYLQ